MASRRPSPHPSRPSRHGLALAPEDRKREGLVLGMSVAENTSLACLPRFERHRFHRRGGGTPDGRGIGRTIPRKDPFGQRRSSAT